ncbi:MAG: type I DNA topoisomerase [Bacteroidales bacterium]|nr:type I DNA topoisomerase [Bacteroidales bacterium]
MSDNLVIVESPAKAKTIEKLLGKEYSVVSSFGHIRDLAKKNLGINIDKGFVPEYEVPAEKQKVVAALRKAVSGSSQVWIASDEDREGEAIAWHLAIVLGLDPGATKRIVFHEITKEAISAAVANPRHVDMNLVNAQQARRILDRIVGFEISPVLWKKVQPSLSAGRVQSVAVRLIVEREREIIGFSTESSFRVTALFLTDKADPSSGIIKAEAGKRFKTEREAIAFLESCRNAIFTVSGITVKPGTRTPAPPFTTSTLQQEAYRKLGFSVAQTMSVAQKLYEAGKITYMRTDSTNLSKMALGLAHKMIASEYGENYSKTRQYKTKSKGAQEAHEAIRPTYLDKPEIAGSQQEKRLYDLIWKRTIASQMADAIVEKTTLTIDASGTGATFTAAGEVIKFDGFLKVYTESTDNDQADDEKSVIPPVKEGSQLWYDTLTATEKYTSPPPRYTEASLVRKLEELGIGRPSTYAPTISTIQNRGYVVREDRPGEKREIRSHVMKNGIIKPLLKTEMAGREKAKLFPMDIGMIVNDFLMDNFSDIVDYQFTATVEKQFDDIAEGKLDWSAMLGKFYSTFHPTVENTLSKTEKKTGSRVLGNHPETGEPVSVKMGRYGPVVQIGEASDDHKPRYASLLKSQLIETITLDEALELFRLPRQVGEHNDKEVVAGIGRFGPFIRHDGKFYSLKKGVDDPYTVNIDRAVEIINDKAETEKQKTISEFGEYRVLNGRYGPYIAFKKENHKIPRGTDPAKLTLEDCIRIVQESAAKPKVKGRKRSR